MDTLTIQLHNPRGMQVLQGLADLGILSIVQDENGRKQAVANPEPAKAARIAKAKALYGSLSKEAGEDLDQHLKQVREEWDRDN